MTYLLQRLKIVRSLVFFIEGNLSGKHFRIRQKQTMERLSDVDIIFIEESVISTTEHLVRDEKVTEIQNIDKLTSINNSYKLKIVTPESKQSCLDTYGSDIPDSKIYIEHSQSTAEENINNLVNATFIAGCTTDRFVNGLLPIYESLNYKIAYVSNA